MAELEVNVRLRPIRFGFVVRPNDLSQVLWAFRTNSVLWGGKFNPIIPYLGRIPRWWARRGGVLQTASQVMDGYIDFFEPDFIVEAEPGLASTLDYDEARVLPKESVFSEENFGRAAQSTKRYGLTVTSLYRDLYKKEFQFVRRKDARVVNVDSDQRDLKNFSASVWGEFPLDPKHSHYAEDFRECFDPKRVVLTNGRDVANLLRSGCRSALQVGSQGVEVRYHSWDDPSLFVFDSTAPQDLIDYWNLRAGHGPVVPIPLSRVADMSDLCREFIAANYRPLPDNDHGVMIHPKVIFGRSISSEDTRALYEEYFRVEGAACSLQNWYPSLWKPSPSFTVRKTRPTLIASETSFDSSADLKNQSSGESKDIWIRFGPLAPDFVPRYGHEFRWANVVEIVDWTHDSRVPQAFPTNCRRSLSSELSVGVETVLSTTEGLTFFPRSRELGEHWRVPIGSGAICQWLESVDIVANPSDAGRVTDQVVRALGGLHGVSTIANRKVVELLDEIARRPVLQSMQYQEFSNKVRNAVGKNIWAASTFESLVARRAVELGMELRCPACLAWSWKSIKQLDFEIECERCRRKFEFPAKEPTNSQKGKWSYRVVGPFALPDFAQGGYASALAMRFLSTIVGSHRDVNLTWSPGLDMKLPGGESIEADYVCWHQRKKFLENDYATEVIFGESKSFRGRATRNGEAGKDAFSAIDVARMKRFAKLFPGSVLIFSTMKEAEELSGEEIRRIRQLAFWGRERILGGLKSRAPVIVLTGLELFAAYSLREAWRSASDRHAELIRPAMVRPENLSTLADLTQQLYLAMPPYGDWLLRKRR